MRQPHRVSFAVHLRFAAVSALTAWTAMWSWRGFTLASAQFIVALAVVGVAVAATGALARWRRLPGVLVVLAQVVVGTVATCQVLTSRPYPGAEFRTRLADAVDAANTYASPVPSTELVSVQPLLVVGGLAAMLMVDLCAATLRRVPLAGLPLLAVYSVPISLIDRGLSWWVFTATAAGFLVLLFLQEEEHLSRWGRSLDGSTAPVRRLSDAARASALAVGSIATAAAVLLPLAIPTLSFSVFDVGPGNGGSGEIQVINPLVDLREDLVRGDNVDLITIRTADPSPDHLRISVLNRFAGNEWSAGDRAVPTSNLAQPGALPPIDDVNPGLVEFDEVAYDLAVTDAFESRWLPTQSPITDIAAEGNWRFDDSTRDFLAGDDDASTAGLDYEMTAALPTYANDRLLLLNTSPSTTLPELTELPDNLPPAIEAYAREATREGTTDFQRAVLLNQFFRESGGFEYALPTDPGGGVGSGELVDFLDPEAPGGRIGYCEQYAAAMGVMARQLGIPARVAVGFLAPTRVPGKQDTWVYRSDDLHAWVELFFPGAGWVLFDPTPAARVEGSQLPSYAEEQITNSLPTDDASRQQTADRPGRPVEPTPSAPVGAQEVPGTAATPTGDGSSFPWIVVLAVLGAMALLVVLALTPRALRRRQRERRLAGGPESAWEELRATAVDLRLPWPEGRSPRETRDVLVLLLGRPGGTETRPAQGPHLAPDAVDSLGRIVDELERLRYSRRHSVEPGSQRDDVVTVCGSLAAGTPLRTRRRATWLPGSVTQRRLLTEPDDARAAEPDPLGARSEVL